MQGLACPFAEAGSAVESERRFVIALQPPPD